VLSTYLPGGGFLAFESALVGGGWFWLVSRASRAHWLEVFWVGGLLAIGTVWVYALVWLIDTKLNVWDADGKMVRTGLTGICCGLLFLTAIVVCLYQL